MIICPNCSKTNEDHYKFCLGCGTELSKLARIDGPGPTALPGAARPATRPAPAPAPVRMPAPAPVAVPAPLPVPVVAVPAPVVPALAPAPPASVVPRTVTPAQGISRAELNPTPALAPAPSPVPQEAFAPTQDLAHSRPALAEPTPVFDPELPFDMSLDGDSASQDLSAAAAAVAGVEFSPPTFPEPPVPAVELPPEVADVPLATVPDASADAVLAAAGRPGVQFEPAPAPASPQFSDPRLCGSCGAAVPEGFKFCGVCGTRYEARQRPAGLVFVPNVQDVSSAPARIIVIHPDGTEGDVFPLGHSETTVGRSHPSSIFSEDPFLSPRHATFYFVRGQLFARDEGSLNGIFVRIKAEVELFHGDMFRIGQQLLRFEEMSQVRPVLPGAGDGTTVMGSPVRGAWARLASIVALNTSASVWVLRRPEEQIGRERGELTFPDDGFVSGAHCKVITRDGRFFLRDLDSTNGTYLRIKAEGILAQGDLILLGQQLFKIDLSH